MRICGTKWSVTHTQILPYICSGSARIAKLSGAEPAVCLYFSIPLWRWKIPKIGKCEHIGKRRVCGLWLWAGMLVVGRAGNMEGIVNIV